MDQPFWASNSFITLVEDIAKYLRCQQNISNKSSRGVILVHLKSRRESWKNR